MVTKNWTGGFKVDIKKEVEPGLNPGAHQEGPAGKTHRTAVPALHLVGVSVGIRDG